MNKTNLSDKDILVGAAIYLLLYTIPNTDTRGRRVRKKIIRSIKQKLASYKNENPSRYLKLINMAEDVIMETKNNYYKKGYTSLGISPAAMFNILSFRYRDIIDTFSIDDLDIKHLIKDYSDVKLTYNTVVYTNIMIRTVHDMLGINMPIDYLGPEDIAA